MLSLIMSRSDSDAIIEAHHIPTRWRPRRNASANTIAKEIIY